ncbi:hypothetical protein DUI87_18626 [Hirundo rustica rustica]|uniref:Uncharacterized protein n=1 Tax=Hirundo rustica rustica TaxID=333673 RepID=A0A3M0K2I2_HIRRU|nr:hypothetical protein DUI87_18626 [Hirundo rustica rustica]
MESGQASGQIPQKRGSAGPARCYLSLSGQRKEEKGPTYRKSKGFIRVTLAQDKTLFELYGSIILLRPRHTNLTASSRQERDVVVIPG